MLVAYKIEYVIEGCLTMTVKLRIGKGKILRASARADEGTVLAGCGY